MSSSSSASVRVEKATSDLLIGPDWTLNLEICDSINSDHWQAKDVVKAVKKRLQNKNPKVQFLALTLLETMIKNCGDYVHFQVVERDILQEMVKIVRKKTDMQVRDKILLLLDSWQEAFGGARGKYPQYYLAYIDLKRSGVEFPRRTPDSTLIFTPPVTCVTSIPRHPQAGYGMPSNSTLRLDEAMASEMANLSLSDLDSMCSVTELLSDMLKAVNPNDPEAVKDEVIADLVSQCRSNQKKVMQFVSSTRDEELLGQGLALNDNIQSLLAKHNAIASGSPLPIEASEPNPGPSVSAVSTPEPDPRPSTYAVPTTALTKGFEDEEEDDDDDFAQLARRNSRFKPATTHSSSAVTSDQSASPSHRAAEGSSANNALTLPDPPAPVRTATKEQDMIDLLSITLASNQSPPHTPLTPCATNQNESPLSVSPNGQACLYNPKAYAVNQGYTPYSSYVAPWAQPQHQSTPPLQLQAQSQPQTQPQMLHSSYPPPPWETVPANTNTNPFASTVRRYPASTAHAAYGPNASVPPQFFNSFGSRINSTPATTGEAQVNPAAQVPNASVMPSQYYNSSGSRINSTQSTTRERASAALRPTGLETHPKPYILSNRLFEDLIDLRNADGSLKQHST